AFLLKALHDAPDQPAVDAIGFEENEGSLHDVFRTCEGSHNVQEAPADIVRDARSFCPGAGRPPTRRRATKNHPVFSGFHGECSYHKWNTLPLVWHSISAIRSLTGSLHERRRDRTAG